ncbi:hypothetical protein Dda_1411 [Drechslerella dactyloides]|uniref:Methylated-DNA-[protein]-cysteine S-methyltransferase DNA binding domain-containing protein n=1 Tax=Drechslerella dactyloides TaxID=74499 RepID=A0AAD6NLE4_DREDA|nr:hypothetical protein Dda_1411 [Drechslerella dactyloides]
MYVSSHASTSSLQFTLYGRIRYWRFEMPRSDEAEAFFVAVYEAVQEIPHGKVTSYGHIAKLAGYPSRPRQVGVALKHLPVDTAAEFNSANVPWQRVVNAQGVISQREMASGMDRQADVLRGEGVTVTMDRQGTMSVDFAAVGWFPRVLPSREGEEDDYDEEDDDEE